MGVLGRGVKRVRESFVFVLPTHFDLVFIVECNMTTS